ncbi:MAG: transposase [Ardenticatenia bacterium]|nr:transposase [Ardenticatenia bacterium]
MITKVQVAPNVTDDSTLLKEAGSGLKERTELETLYTDGSYGSPENDRLLEEHEVMLMQTAIRGRRRGPERLYLDDFQVEREPGGEPQRVVCPQHAVAEVRRSRSGKSFAAEFDETQCAACPLQAQCPAKARQRKGGQVLRFTWQDLRRTERHRQARAQRETGRNLRAAVEATVRSLKHPFAGGKVPVRGRFRVACMVIGVAAVVNIRRLHRAIQARKKSEAAQAGQARAARRENQGQEEGLFSFVRCLWHALTGLRPRWASTLLVLPA